MSRVGIYSGTFNPVHVGHVAFALQAMQEARLDQLYFLPERQPRRKAGVEHFAHRVAMLRQALRPYPSFGVLEFDDRHFSIGRTLPKLQAMFPDDELVFLMGSDVAKSVVHWPHASQLFAQSELVIAIRATESMEQIQTVIEGWTVQPNAVMVIQSYAPGVSSHAIREALRARRQGEGLLKSVAQYSNHHWLYVSLA